MCAQKSYINKSFCMTVATLSTLGDFWHGGRGASLPPLLLLTDQITIRIRFDLVASLGFTTTPATSTELTNLREFLLGAEGKQQWSQHAAKYRPCGTCFVTAKRSQAPSNTWQ